MTNLAAVSAEVARIPFKITLSVKKSIRHVLTLFRELDYHSAAKVIALQKPFRIASPERTVPLPGFSPNHQTHVKTVKPVGAVSPFQATPAVRKRFDEPRQSRTWRRKLSWVGSLD